MDTSMYGGQPTRAADPDAELRAAVAELLRILVPGGALLVTVPYGRREDHGWFRQLDRADLESLLPRGSLDVYAYSGEGWQTSSAGAAAGAAYYDHHADRTVPLDRAAAARAVACLSLRK